MIDFLSANVVAIITTAVLALAVVRMFFDDKMSAATLRGCDVALAAGFGTLFVISLSEVLKGDGLSTALIVLSFISLILCLFLTTVGVKELIDERGNVLHDRSNAIAGTLLFAILGLTSGLQLIQSLVLG